MLVAITPAEARRLAKDYVVKKKAPPSSASVTVSDFGKLADGSYSVLVDVKDGPRTEKNRVRYRVKMDAKGEITSFVTR